MSYRDYLQDNVIFTYGELEIILDKINDRTSGISGGDVNYFTSYLKYELESLQHKKESARRVKFNPYMAGNPYIRNDDEIALTSYDGRLTTGFNLNVKKPKTDAYVEFVPADDGTLSYYIVAPPNGETYDFDTLAGVSKFLKEGNHRGVWTTDDEMPVDMGFVTADDAAGDSDEAENEHIWRIGK